jgi:hypothetical protein
MSISTRFRDISREVTDYYTGLKSQGEDVAKGARDVKKARAELAEWAEQVGEIPRMSLEYKLTPVLLKAHNDLDRARLVFEEDGHAQQAATAWGLQQKIYRLLNDL